VKKIVPIRAIRGIFQFENVSTMRRRCCAITYALCVGIALEAAATQRYVDLNSPSPAPPYADWTTAATNIQDAVDAALPGDTIIVTNGLYATGGRVVYGAMTNRVAVTKALTLQSINGPAQTIIQGFQVPGTTNGNAAVRCVYLTNGATLIGFTLAQGATRSAGDTVREESGGGVYCESTSAVVSNCWINGNSSANYGGGTSSGTLTSCTVSNNTCVNGRGSGGGAWSGVLSRCVLVANTAYIGGGANTATLNNCLLIGNRASYGGGAGDATLNGCTVVNNTATLFGGGVDGGTADTYVNNCIVYFNAAPSGPNWSGGTLKYCCTIPLPGGSGHITNAPLFVDFSGGNFHLASNSPCINSGKNTFATTTDDFDSNPRISGGTVDIGAYEFQNPTSTISYAWLQQYGFPMDGSADFADGDGDGMGNWAEWKAGTDPANAASVLKILTVTNNLPGLRVQWQSVTTRTYLLQRSFDLAAQPAFSTIRTNILGLAGTTSFTDTNAMGAGPFFYRVGVE
jgi:hypothetical protein